MIAAPAVDIRGGRCVQLVGGDPATEVVALPDPVVVAQRWRSLGFGTLHVVDLDAALGTGDNLTLVERILATTSAEVQVGGGVRDEAAVQRLWDAGARRAIVGTMALEDPDRLGQLAGRWPGRLMVAADVRERSVLARGWTVRSEVGLDEFLSSVCALPLAGVLFTDVAREGRLEGVDMAVAEWVVARSAVPVWVAGGIATLEDLRALRSIGAAGAVLGMSIYTGRLDARAVAEEFGGVVPSGQPGAMHE
jgi:phosphoribosylformimino-5-aminoimidazole carboxamide ribotide isomerase